MLVYHKLSVKFVLPINSGRYIWLLCLKLYTGHLLQRFIFYVKNVPYFISIAIFPVTHIYNTVMRDWVLIINEFWNLNTDISLAKSRQMFIICHNFVTFRNFKEINFRDYTSNVTHLFFPHRCTDICFISYLIWYL